MSTNHRYRIHSHISPLDLPGGAIFTVRSSNGAAAPVSDQTVVATGARDGGQNTHTVNYDLAELVWKYFANEIQESFLEVQESLADENLESRKQLRN